MLIVFACWAPAALSNVLYISAFFTLKFENKYAPLNYKTCGFFSCVISKGYNNTERSKLLKIIPYYVE
jgi:hypothetical protein